MHPRAFRAHPLSPALCFVGQAPPSFVPLRPGLANTQVITPKTSLGDILDTVYTASNPVAGY